MEMALNTTFFIQIFHFLLAYILFDRTVMRLATALVMAEDRKLEQLETESAESQQKVANRIRYNEDDWIILQKRLTAECPTPRLGMQSSATEYEAQPIPPTLHQRVIDEAVYAYKTALSQRIVAAQGRDDQHNR